MLYDISYANIIMLSATLPSYKTDDDRQGGKRRGKDIKSGQDIIWADDPRNREKVRDFFKAIE